MTRSNQKTQNLVMLAVFVALVLVLQTVSALAAKFGIFSITLTLVPIVVGGILMGPANGAILGFVFGVMVSIFSITGLDAGGLMVFQANPFLGWLVCLLKGTMAGFLPALLYHALPKKMPPLVSAFIASILAPIANTGIFLAGMYLFFRDVLSAWTGGSLAFFNVVVAICGINFIIEFAVSVVLSPAIASIVKAVKKL